MTLKKPFVCATFNGHYELQKLSLVFHGKCYTCAMNDAKTVLQHFL